MSAGLLVVGVGRSGTSVATRLAVNLGLRPPPEADLLPANHANPDGYWESTALAACNDRLLAAWSSTWWTPPREVTAEMVRRLDGNRSAATTTFDAVFGPSSGWVWKDPRLTTLLPFWSEILPNVPVLVPFRHPSEVARSISRRDGLSIEQSLAVAERHCRLLLGALAGRAVLLADHADLVADPAGWTARLRDFVIDHGLAVDEPVVAPADLVTPPSAWSRPPAGAAPEPSGLHDLFLELAGAHAAFPTVTLPTPGPGVDRIIETVEPPAWYVPA